MTTPDESKRATDLLVVIDHLEARVYRTELSGTVPVRISPYDPLGYGSQAISVEN